MSIPEEKYKNMPLERLLVYSILSVLRKREECTFERLIKESFTLFPKSFSFYRYPEWPDSLKLDRPLRNLRKNGYISGNPKTKYTLTKFGEKYAVSVEKEMLSDTVLKKKPLVAVGRKEKKLMDYIKELSEFKRFVAQKGNITLEKGQIIKVAFSTMETPIKTIEGNLEMLTRFSREAKEVDLEKFLKFCSGQLLKYGRK